MEDKQDEAPNIVTEEMAAVELEMKIYLENNHPHIASVFQLEIDRRGSLGTRYGKKQPDADGTKNVQGKAASESSLLPGGERRETVAPEKTKKRKEK